VIQIKSLGIEGVGPYKDKAVLSVRPGVTVIYGKNRLRDNNANFVGKSLLVRSIEELVYDPAVRQDKKTGARYISLTAKGKDVVLSSDGGNVDVTVNGKDLTKRTKTETKKLVQKIWPLSQEDFSTYVYVDALASHPLVKGTGAARKAFMNTFFRLDQLDEQKKVFAKQRLELKKVRAAYTELERTYTEISKDLLPSNVYAKYTKGVKKYSAEVVRLSELLHKSQESSQLLAFKKVAGSRIEKNPRPADEVKAELRNARKAKEALAEYEDYLRDLARYRKSTDGLDMSVSMAALKKDADRFRAASGVEKPKRPRDPGGARLAVPVPSAELFVRVADVQHRLDHIGKHKNGVCYACGQSVVENVDDLREQWKKLKRRATAAQEAESQNEEIDAYEKAMKVFRSELAEYNAAQATAAELEDRHALYEKRRSLSEPEVVEKPKGLSGSSIEELEAELELSIFHEEHEDEIRKILSGKLERIAFDPDELQKAQTSLSKYRTLIAVHDGVAERAAQIEGRLLEMKKQLSQEEELDLILKGYDDKAVKKMAIEAISQRLMEVVNSCSVLVLPSYRFELVWESTGISILARRPNGGVSDVRKLSGAESMLFTLVLIFALLVFVPDSKRVNTLILDEPTASFSEASTELFIKLLAHVQTVIPSVIVVTPKTLRIPEARCLTVVQDSKGSRLVKGHPDDL
jgi:DNA repair exonuclease SbcCD ATPase subunit